jgi:hypothetical protein
MTEPTPDEIDPTAVEIDLQIHDITQSTEVE